MEKWQDPETLTIWFIIILGFVLILVTSVIIMVRISYLRVLRKNREENQLKVNHQRALLETNIEVQERERERIAADLHDELIGKLTAVRLTNQVHENNKEVDSLISDSITVARRITHDLSPPLIEMTPLNELLNELFAPWKRSIDLNFYTDIRAEFKLSSSYKVQLKRIAQEILTNTTKHAQATRIDVTLRQTTAFLVLQIKDNGKGMDVTKAKKGLGLKNIESRIQFINAAYSVTSKKEKGTSFLIILKQHKT